MVTLTYGGEVGGEVIVEGILEDDSALAAKGALPIGERGRGEAVGNEVVVVGVDFDKGIECGGLLEGVAKGDEGGGGGLGIGGNGPHERGGCGGAAVASSSKSLR